jgi:hypothetical protein
MQALRVLNIVDSPVLLASEKGEILKLAIIEALENSPFVIVDFLGYQFISSTFFNYAFAALCIDKEWSKVKFDEHIQIQGLSEDDADELELCLFNVQQRRKLLESNVNTEEFYATRIPA